MFAVAHAVLVFLCRWFPRAHLFTNYPRFFRAQRPYYIDYGFPYEPYLIVDKSQRDFPSFHEGFYNRNANKAEQVLKLFARGFKVYLFPSAVPSFLFSVALSPLSFSLRCFI